MILQGLVLSVLRRSDQIPDKTLNLFISFVVFDAVDQEGPTNHLHVLFVQVPLKPTMGQDILPAPPAGVEETYMQ